MSYVLLCIQYMSYVCMYVEYSYIIIISVMYFTYSRKTHFSSYTYNGSKKKRSKYTLCKYCITFRDKKNICHIMPLYEGGKRANKI